MMLRLSRWVAICSWVLVLGGAPVEVHAPEVRDADDALRDVDVERELIIQTGLEELALHSSEACMETFSCCYGSSVTTTGQAWEAVKSFAQNYFIRELLDSTPRMLERHYSFYKLYDQMQQRKTMQIWATDCYYGVVTVILNALPAIELEEGLQEAQRALSVADGMLRRDPAAALRANWSIPTQPLDRVLPFFLGARRNNCSGSSLRIYVYDTGNLSRGSVFCSAGQWGVEVALHRYFAAAACRTQDPEEADFFLVPDYRACQLHLAPKYRQEGLTRIPGDDYHSAVIRDHRSKYRDPAETEGIFKRLVGGLEHFQKRRGVDHIFIFSDQGFIVNFTHTFPSWRDTIPHSIFLSTEAFTPGCGPSCFSPWKDIVIPGHLDLERQNSIRAHSLPSSRRSLLFNFHGRLPVNHNYYENNSVRGELLQFATRPDVSVGGFVEDYFEIMGNSHFCAIPEGTSSWTNHLYESFFAGCIPLILSDHFVLPFQDLIDWPSLSVRWPQGEVGEEMYNYLHALVHGRPGVVEQMKQRVDEAACWFDFYALDDDEDSGGGTAGGGLAGAADTAGGTGSGGAADAADSGRGPGGGAAGGATACSPYRGILHSLERRKEAMPKYLGSPRWGP